MSDQPNGIAEQIDQLTAEFATKIASISSSEFILDGVVKHAITSLVWDLYRELPDNRIALGEALEDWPDHIRKAMTDDAAKPDIK